MMFSARIDLEKPAMKSSQSETTKPTEKAVKL